jgi:hypothetical protein
LGAGRSIAFGVGDDDQPLLASAGGAHVRQYHVAADRRSQSLRHSQVGFYKNSHVEGTSTPRQAGHLLSQVKAGARHARRLSTPK